MSQEQVYTVASDSDTAGDERSSAPFPEIAIGVDIGTSQCSLAVWNGSQVELIRNTRNQKLMKSYVTFRDESPVGGVTNQLSHEYEMLSGASVFNMKRLIGRIDTDPVVSQASKTLPFLIQTLGIGVKPFIAALVNNMWRSTTPEEVFAIYLVELKSLAELRLKRPVRNIVLTVPAAFSRFQLTRITRACAMAGLHVLRLMPEPAAVALLYAQQQQQNQQSLSDSGSEKIALIFNMGAGYTDVAIIATAGGVSQMKGLAGTTIGGEDLLQNTMHYLLPDMDNFFASRGVHEIKSMGVLRVATQDAIHKLSSQSKVQIDVDLGNGINISKIIDLEEFEEVNKDVFQKCGSLITRCLNDSKVKIEHIDDVILVGGCTNIPKVKNTVMSICKKTEIYSGINPLEAAVRGAALEGALAGGVTDPMGNLDLLTIQVNSHSIGIRADKDSFVPIIPRNTTMPARREVVFTTAHDNQREALIVVYEGDEEVVEKNHLLGYFKVVGIPLASRGVPEINVCMDIDASNMLRVMAAVVMPGGQNPVVPPVEVRMPTADDGHGLSADVLNRSFGSTMDLVTLRNTAAYSGKIGLSKVQVQTDDYILPSLRFPVSVLNRHRDPTAGDDRRWIRKAIMGTNSVNWHSVLDSDQWVALPVSGQRPSARYKHAAVVADEKLYIVGGSRNGRYLSDVQAFDLKKLTWSTVKLTTKSDTDTDVFPSVSGHSMVKWGNKLIFLGGHSKDTSDNVTVRFIDLESHLCGTMETTGKVPEARGGQSVSLVGSKLIMFGGEDKKRQLMNDVHVLDLNTFTWTVLETIQTPPSPRFDHTAAVHADRYLLIFGGCSHSIFFNDLHVLDLETLEWSNPQIQGDLVSPRAGHAAVSIDENWFIVGGGDNKSGAIETLVMDISKLVISTLTNVKERDPLASEGLTVSSAVIDNEHYLVAFGGYNGKYNNEVFVMKPKPKDSKHPKIFQSPAAAAAAASVTAAYALAKSESLEFTTTMESKPKVDLSVEVNIIKGEKKTLESSITEVKSVNSSLMEKLEECNGAGIDLSKELHSVKGQLASERSRCSDLEAQILDLKKKLSSKKSIEEEVEAIRSEKSTIDQDLEISGTDQKQDSGGVWRWIAG